MPHFETFTQRSTPIERRPLISIQRRGTLSANKTAFEALGSPAAVEMLYDREAQIIGLRPVDPSVRHAYPVRRQAASQSYLLAFHAFANYYQIPLGEPRRYIAEVDNGVLTVDLKQEPIPLPDRRRVRTDAQQLAG